MRTIKTNTLAGPENSRFAFLDILRIFAFLSVLLGHKFFPELVALSVDIEVHATFRLLASLLIPLTAGGGAGVVVFFLVSGYIISHVIQKENPGVFLIKRIFRVYPLFVFAILAEVAMNKIANGTPIPQLSELLPRLLLLGDFFSVPYALAGVEWTLRIEIIFYILVGAIKCVRPLNMPLTALVFYFFATAALQWFGPFPRSAPLYVGYITLYMPFLFSGSCIYFFEKNIHKPFCLMFILYVVCSYLILLPKINPGFMHYNFAVYSLLIFLLAWKCRHSVKNIAFITFLSELTFSVYLLHNWAWDHIDRYLVKSQPGVISDKIKIAAILLVICALTYKLVEKTFIGIGARLAARYGKGRVINAGQLATLPVRDVQGLHKG